MILINAASEFSGRLVEFCHCRSCLLYTLLHVLHGVFWNDCFRRIFNYSRWESVHDFPYCCGLRPMHDMYSFFTEKDFYVVFVCRQLFNVLRFTVQLAYCKHVL